MAKDQLPLTLLLQKKEGKLVTAGKLHQMQLDAFLDNMEEGDKIEVTYEPIHTDVSYAQLSKLHKCIRVVASDTGSDFLSIKKIIKERAGLYSIKPALKSFAACSKDEISSAIQAVILLGDELGINLHN